MMSANPVVVKVHTAPRVVLVLGLGWLVVGVLALVNSDFADRWEWAPIGVVSGILCLLVDRPIRIVFDSRRGMVSIFRPMLVPWTTRILECPMSEIANAQIIMHPPAEPFDQHWGRGRWGLMLTRRSGEPVPILERTGMTLEPQRDRINELLKSFDR